MAAAGVYRCVVETGGSVLNWRIASSLSLVCGRSGPV